LTVEAAYMAEAFPSPPPEAWYEARGVPLPWALVAGKLDGCRVLDIGCATGWLGRLAQREGALVLALDIFDTACYPKLPFKIAAKENIPCLDEIFDYIITANVLHHGGLERGGWELVRVLKPGGLLLSLQEPCIRTDEDEAAVLLRDCLSEMRAGIAEHRPNLRQYRAALAGTDCTFYACNGTILEPGGHTFEPLPCPEDDYRGGVTIAARKWNLC
jgi:SAM-dependent methyltransferase